MERGDDVKPPAPPEMRDEWKPMSPAVFGLFVAGFASAIAAIVLVAVSWR
jgi:hypothetical protein